MRKIRVSRDYKIVARKTQEKYHRGFAKNPVSERGLDFYGFLRLKVLRGPGTSSLYLFSVVCNALLLHRQTGQVDAPLGIAKRHHQNIIDTKLASELYLMKLIPITPDVHVLLFIHGVLTSVAMAANDFE